MKKPMVLVLTLVLVVALLFSACSTSPATNATSSSPSVAASDSASPAASSAAPAASSAAANGKTIKVVVMPKLIGIPYFNAAEQGAKEAAKDFGFEVIYTGPTEADATQQANMVENYISQKVDAICVAPDDPAGLKPTLEKAKAAGITILDWDTEADKSVVDYSIHAIDDQQLGEHMFKALFDKIGKKEGKYALLTGGLEAANLNTWIKYGLAMAAKDYPGMKLVTDKIPTNEKQQEAYQKTLDLLKAYPDIDGIECQSTPTSIGAGQAIQELGLQDKVAVVGHAMPKDAAQYLKDGSIDLGILWDVKKLGYLTAYTAYMKVSGQKITDGMDVKTIGKIQLKEDGKTIIMGPPLDITKENCDTFSF